MLLPGVQEALVALAARGVRFQNAYDMVPCTPLESEGYRHLNYAYLISFFRDDLMGKLSASENHAIENYQIVLTLALANQDGFFEGTFAGVHGHEMRSIKPEPEDVCRFLQEPS